MMGAGAAFAGPEQLVSGTSPSGSGKIHGASDGFLHNFLPLPAPFFIFPSFFCFPLFFYFSLFPPLFFLFFSPI